MLVVQNFGQAPNFECMPTLLIWFGCLSFLPEMNLTLRGKKGELGTLVILFLFTIKRAWPTRFMTKKGTNSPQVVA